MRLRASAFLIGLLAACSCSAQSPTQYVYVAEQATATIDAFSVNSSTGVLTPVPGTPFNERLTPVALATNPQGTFLFVANSTPPSVSVFAIQANGALQEITNSPFSQDQTNTPAALGVSPDGTLLYVAGGETTVNASLGFLDVYAIASGGALTPATQTGGPVFQINSGTLNALYVHPSGRWLYVSGGTSGNAFITQFDVSSSAISVVGPTGIGSISRALIGTSSYLFSANGQLEGFIRTEAISAVDGTLTEASSFGGTQTTGTFPGSETLDSTGSFLYAAFDQNSSFSVASGVLTPLGTTAITNLSPLFASPTSPVLFAGNPSSPALSSFVIAANGSLTAATGSPFTLAGIATAITTTGVAQVASAPGAGFSPATLTLPGVTTGQTSTGMASLVSTGTTTLDISDISLSGSSYITQMNACPATLAPQATCTINFSFAPTATGTFMATLQVTGNASAMLDVVGTAAAPVPMAGVAPNFLSFPNTDQGSTSSPMTFTVTATGTAQLNVTSVALGGANPGDFKISSNNCGMLAVNSFCTVGVEFFPQATGGRNATVSVTDNASSSPQTVMLSGTGEPIPPPPPQVTLTVSAAGPGGVTQSMPGTLFAPGSVVQLTAVPGTSATFTSWSGACQGATAVCNVTMSANESATATFASGTANQSDITVTPSAQSGSAGQAFTFNLTLALAGSPTFTVTGCPTGATCSVASNGNGDSLSVTTVAPTEPGGKLGWLLLLLATPFLMPKRKRFALISAAALVICAACGGGSGAGNPPVNPGTPNGQYTVVVNASSQGNTAIGQATVTVN
jgi:Divergent InlB B-repeat domain/Lactonase, 7-bladed beta-propeller